MRIDFDRICELAGTGKRGSSRRALNENYESEVEESNYESEVEESNYEEGPLEGLDVESELEETDGEEMVEVDVSELMSEIRRAKRLMNESRKRQQRKRLNESRRKDDHLKQIIANEVESILSEIEEKDSSWIYGKRKPRHSKQGYSNQGRTLPGIGFKNNW
jgi:hypothetical protein